MLFLIFISLHYQSPLASCSELIHHECSTTTIDPLGWFTRITSTSAGISLNCGLQIKVNIYIRSMYSTFLIELGG